MKRSSPGMAHVVSLLGAFVVSSIVLGLLAAGVVMPAVGIVGLGAKQAVGTFDALPAEFTASPMSQQSTIVAADGTVVATLREENRTVVPITKIAKVMQNAQIAIEDSRYYEHGGVDPRGLVRAIVSTAQGDKQGASTITQQYIKQTLVYSALKNDDKEGAEAAQARGGIPGMVRKLQEARYALALEQKLNKQQILEGYLNLVYYGAGAYGVEAAAKRYFATSAAQLTIPQAALIAGMAQRPVATDPFVFPKAALERRNAVLGRMQTTGFISKRAYLAAVKTPIVLKSTQGQASCPASKDPYYCEYIKKWLLDQPSLGETKSEREKRIYRGGLKIQTTYDVAANAKLKDIITNRVPAGAFPRVGAAAAIVEPGTGKIIAMAQNSDFSFKEQQGETSINFAVDQRYGASGGFQIGSTAKMFAVVAALEQGMTADSYIQAPPDGTKYSVSHLGGTTCGMGGPSYGPYNAESNEHGGMSLEHATAKSVNTAFLELAARVGVCKEAEVMKRMGLHRGDGQDYHEGPASVILGASDASPLTLAASYATLAAGGKYCTPYPVTKVTAFDGTTYPINTGGCRQAIEPKVALRATRILQSVLGPGGTGKDLGIGRPAAGKTGTADNSVETWFAGFTPQRSTAVWVGTPKSQRSLSGVSLGGRSYGKVYGATIAGPIWRAAMIMASKGLPEESFRLVETDGNAAEEAPVPDVTGRSESSARSRLEQAGFQVRVSQDRTPSDTVDEGNVVSTSPEVGQKAPKGETITLTLSSGRPSPGEGATTDGTGQDGTDENDTTDGASPDNGNGQGGNGQGGGGQDDGNGQRSQNDGGTN